ncbi:MAG: tetratricopeptide repeat protein [Chloroflexi bacterium]|nr:tetratricopeptide repeat protein [Chloroflexota bacterium]
MPVSPRPLIGRAREVDEIRRLIVEDEARLVTLTGPGGVGKTRLALAVAGLLAPEFPAGVRFVDLAPVTDASLVPSAIGRACGLIHDNAQAPMLSLTRALRDLELLIVLDNYEQVIEAATDVAQLLDACPRLRAIATSREPLRLRSEWEFPLQPLALPLLPEHAQPLSQAEVDTLARNPSIALFVQRARAVRPNFGLAGENARVVAEACIRLDGLPLAIELAAARTRFVPPSAALRLQHPLDLQSGLRDAPARHRTLREAIAWSFGLLSVEQQAVFNRMAVFAGGCSLDAAQAVCRPGEPDDDGVFAVLADLVQRNLLLSIDDGTGEPRFRLLETVREFALEQLEASGQADATRWSHAAYFEALVGQALPRLGGAEQRAWLDVLARELDNLRAALRWLIQRGDEASLRTAAELNWALWPFWWARGYLSEARRWSTAILDQPLASAIDRGRAAWVASTAALDEGDYSAAPALVATCLEVFRANDDPRGLARALLAAGWAAPIDGAPGRAIEAHLESIEQFRRAGDETGVILALAGLGNTAMLMGDLDAAADYDREALALARQLGDTHSQAQVLEALGLLALERRDAEQATTLFEQSIKLCLEIGSLELLCYCLVGLAGAALLDGAPERSAQLFGAAEGLRERSGLGVWPVRREVEQRWEAALWRTVDGNGELAREAWADGRAMTLPTVARFAVEEPAPTSQSAPRAPTDGTGDSPLTDREYQVAVLIAHGKTSKEIAEALVITERTADTHAAHIREKLGLRSRAEIAAWMVRQGLNTSSA